MSHEHAGGPLADITRQADLIAATIHGIDTIWTTVIQGAVDTIHADVETLAVTDRHTKSVQGSTELTPAQTDKTDTTGRARTILMPIRHQWAELILQGDRTVLIQRTCPAHPVDRILLYDTTTRTITGRATVTHVDTGNPDRIRRDHGAHACPTQDQWAAYIGDRTRIGALILTDPERYQPARTPADLGIPRRPATWTYLPDTTPPKSVQEGTEFPPAQTDKTDTTNGRTPRAPTIHPMDNHHPRIHPPQV